MRKEFKKAMAESFASVTPIQSACYHYLNDGFSSLTQSIIHQHFTDNPPENCNPKYLEKVIATALIELTYPADTKGGYTWSGCQRSAFSGIPKATWSRNNLCQSTNFIIDTINANADLVSRKIYSQMTA